MTKITKISELPEFDMAEILKTDEDIANYLTAVLEENDPAELSHALGVIARARGMTEVVRFWGPHQVRALPSRRRGASLRGSMVLGAHQSRLTYTVGRSNKECKCLRI